MPQSVRRARSGAAHSPSASPSTRPSEEEGGATPMARASVGATSTASTGDSKTPAAELRAVKAQRHAHVVVVQRPVGDAAALRRNLPRTPAGRRASRRPNGCGWKLLRKRSRQSLVVEQARRRCSIRPPRGAPARRARRPAGSVRGRGNRWCPGRGTDTGMRVTLPNPWACSALSTAWATLSPSTAMRARVSRWERAALRARRPAPG